MHFRMDFQLALGIPLPLKVEILSLAYFEAIYTQQYTNIFKEVIVQHFFACASRKNAYT